MGKAARVLDAIVAIHLGANPTDFGAGALMTREAENRGEPIAIGGHGLAEQANEHQRAFALPQVAVAFLAVAAIGDEVQQVVLNLESGAEKEAEADEGVEVDRDPRTDQGAGAKRKDGGEPAGLFQYHAQVIGVGEIDEVVV